MQDRNNMEFRGLCSYNSGARQIEDVTTGWLYISQRKQKMHTSFQCSTQEMAKILVINTAYLIGYVLTKNCHSSTCFSTAWQD
jgi:hypothetical protein